MNKLDFSFKLKIISKHVNFVIKELKYFLQFTKIFVFTKLQKLKKILHSIFIYDSISIKIYMKRQIFISWSMTSDVIKGHKRSLLCFKIHFVICFLILSKLSINSQIIKTKIFIIWSLTLNKVTFMFKNSLFLKIFLVKIKLSKNDNISKPLFTFLWTTFILVFYNLIYPLNEKFECEN